VVISAPRAGNCSFTVGSGSTLTVDSVINAGAATATPITKDGPGVRLIPRTPASSSAWSILDVVGAGASVCWALPPFAWPNPGRGRRVDAFAPRQVSLGGRGSERPTGASQQFPATAGDGQNPKLEIRNPNCGRASIGWAGPIGLSGW
jgi:hypothetical protein